MTQTQELATTDNPITAEPSAAQYIPTGRTSASVPKGKSFKQVLRTKGSDESDEMHMPIIEGRVSIKTKAKLPKSSVRPQKKLPLGLKEYYLTNHPLHPLNAFPSEDLRHSP